MKLFGLIPLLLILSIPIYGQGQNDSLSDIEKAKIINKALVIGEGCCMELDSCDLKVSNLSNELRLTNMLLETKNSEINLKDKDINIRINEVQYYKSESKKWKAITYGIITFDIVVLGFTTFLVLR